MQQPTTAFIGAGNMAHSLIGGLIADGFSAEKIWASNPVAELLNKLQKQFSIHTTLDNTQAVKEADVVIFAVKPQILKIVAQELAEFIQEKKPLVISIAAGVREKDLQNWLGDHIAIVRCMPNTPALVGAGASALFANMFVSVEQKSIAESILRAVGMTVWLDNEKLLDTVTALSGSGPAYFFLIMEALEIAAVKLGLPADTAHLLTLQTALGAARMALENNQSLAELRQQVTSPGGTTECGIQVLENNHIRKILTETIQAASNRSVELAEILSK